MPDEIKILIVDDDVLLCDTLSDILSLEGYAVEWRTNGKDALKLMKAVEFDLLLLDLLLPGLDGLEVLKRVLRASPRTAVIMMSGHGTIDKAIAATKLGAYDWLEKPLKKGRVLLSLKNVTNMRVLSAEKTHLMEANKDHYKMVGESPALRGIYTIIDKVAKKDITVLITGESGTGKELVARAIHLNGDRGAAPFVEVNCAAIPDTLIESELFGHIKGSFTGAVKDTIGKFQLANKGTLFLDEIGDLSTSAQAKILRAIETGLVSRIGENIEEKVNVRIICATNKHLLKLVEEGTFREDLYHRIHVFDIHIPPLRDRIEDISLIADHFLTIFCTNMKVPQKRFSPSAVGLLKAHSWPGNVRELRNFIEKLVVLVDDELVTGQHIITIFSQDYVSYGYEEGKKYSEAKKSFERSYILQALSANRWNITKTAEVIDMPRSLLYRKIEKYGIRKGG